MVIIVRILVIIILAIITGECLGVPLFFMKRYCGMKKVYVLGDDIGCIELVDYMGNDLSVVNAARISYAKQSGVLGLKDTKLINYLIKHNHTSPLRGIVFTFKVEAPLFVCRQWWKHVIASSHVDDQNQWNEQSGRYVKFVPEFYVPVVFRGQHSINKQSSAPLEVVEPIAAVIRSAYTTACLYAIDEYDYLLRQGVCREQARAILPQAIYTSFVWTVSLQALLHFIDLRDHDGAQWEIRQYAKAVVELIIDIVPYTMEAWQNERRNNP